MTTKPFRHSFGETIFNQKYATFPGQTWDQKSRQLVDCILFGTPDEYRKLVYWAISTMRFIPAGRYLYYAGKPHGVRFFNNCFAMIAEDTREGWAKLAGNSTAALMGGGGVGVVYDNIRPAGSKLERTGGVASGPLPLMFMMNEIGRGVQQGGSRRSALWAGLRWNHPDIWQFIVAKNWSDEVKAAKAVDFNYPAPLDHTNISVILEDMFFANPDMKLWEAIVRQMVTTGEPGIAINLGSERNRKARNACTEFISDEDSDMCNLGSLNYSRIQTIEELELTIKAATVFLMLGGAQADLPYKECYNVRYKKPKIGLGIMGLHEWLIRRGYEYEVTDELHDWLNVYANYTPSCCETVAHQFKLKVPERTRAIAPAGTISLLAGTTSGIEPVYATAMKRRYLVDGKYWKAEYFIDPTINYLIKECGIDPNTVQTAYQLAKSPETRIKFQVEVQKYVDMGISSTINLPAWGTAYNNEKTLPNLSATLLKYAPKLRGITTYPDGARSGQPLVEVPYDEAVGKVGVVFDDFSEKQCKSGVCGI